MHTFLAGDVCMRVVGVTRKLLVSFGADSNSPSVVMSSTGITSTRTMNSVIATITHVGTQQLNIVVYTSTNRALNMSSGSASNYMSIVIGRATHEFELEIATARGDFNPASSAGDTVMCTTNNTTDIVFEFGVSDTGLMLGKDYALFARAVESQSVQTE